MYACGEDELGKEVREGDLVRLKTGEEGIVEFGTCEGKKTNLIGAIKVGNRSFLVCIAGKLIPGVILVSRKGAFNENRAEDTK